MIVIADSNIFFSALITPKGVVASVLAERNRLQFFAPNYVFDEVKENIEKIAELTEKNAKIVWADFLILMKGIEVVDIKNIPTELIRKAEEIVIDIDFDDAIFVALHLHLKHKIWTGDITLATALKEKDYNICITTEELKKRLYKKPEK